MPYSIKYIKTKASVTIGCSHKNYHEIKLHNTYKKVDTIGCNDIQILITKLINCH